MSRPAEYCFIPTNEEKTVYKCLLCDYETPTTGGVVGYCNHVKFKHSLYGEKISVEDYFQKEIEGKTGGEDFMGTCKTCKIPTKFHSISRGYVRFCSHACSLLDKDIAKKRKDATVVAIMKKYGVSNPGQIPGHSEKVKQTCVERYGDANYVNPEKAKQTTLERYGVEHYTQTAEYKAAVKETSLREYGVEHFTQDPKIKEKACSTNRERYGVSYTLQSPEIRERGRTTILANGGYSLQRPELLKSANLKHAEAFSKRLAAFKFDNVELLDVEKRLFKCLRCKKEFIKDKDIGLAKGDPQKFPRCLSCYPIHTLNKCSLFHQEVLGYFISTLGINKSDIIENDKSVLKEINKELDLYIPGKKIAFELNGNIWHTEIYGGKAPDYHLNKTEVCEKNGVRLIHIFEDEWIDKRELVKEKISYLLGTRLDKPTAYARRCVIRPIEASMANFFLDANHLQGGETGSSVRLGAFYKQANKDVLVAVMTFGQPRERMGAEKEEGSWELNRFATDITMKAPGIGSKLFSHFNKNYTPNKVISYADKRWSTSIVSNVYDRLGFKLVSTSHPSYFYVHPNRKNYKLRETRYKFRKPNLAKLFPDYDASKTEWENMKEHGYDKIWDCGTLKYVWNNSSITPAKSEAFRLALISAPENSPSESIVAPVSPDTASI